MPQATQADHTQFTALPLSALAWKLFAAFAVLAALSMGLSIAGKWYGRSIVLAGHTDSLAPHEVVLGEDVVTVPANMIRFPEARRSGPAEALDLYLAWPQMSGYLPALEPVFNHRTGKDRVIFATFEPRSMSADMSGRLATVYRLLIEDEGESLPSGLAAHAFLPGSGYGEEALFVGRRAGEDPFVARCLTGNAAAGALAPCQRDVDVGAGLSLRYRFARTLLDDWRALDAEMMAFAAQAVRPRR